jgi:opacity protein-like surface antigen
MRFLIAALAIALTMASAHAQTAGGQTPSTGQHGSHGRGKADKADAQKPKADDKAYNAALRSLPDKHYDPWHGTR